MERGHRRPTPLQRASWRIEYFFAWLGLRLACALPERLARKLGEGGGSLVRYTGRHYRCALANVKLVYPEWSDERARAVLQASFREHGRSVVEWARMTLLSDEELLARIEWHGEEHLEKAWAKNRGVLVVTAHYGSWELIPAAAQLRFPHMLIAATGRQLGNPHVMRLASERRSQSGGEILTLQPSELVRALRAKRVVGILADLRQHQKHGGVLVPFLGKRAWLPRGPATLSLRTGAPILPVFSRPIGGGRHRIEFRPEIDVAPSGNLRDDTVTITTRFNDEVGRFIREGPEHFVWFGRRWRHSPDAPPDLYGVRKRRRR